jgi:2',3'-cyclic-nucleotide 2'-phosphodiesterase (5'-nucleotidase family)
VDTGDLLFPSIFNPHPPAKKLADLKADLFLKTYNLMGYDAFTPGELDLSFGVANIIQMSKQAKFPFLAANLMDSQSNKPVFKPYVIKEVQGVKVGLLGLISRRFPLGGPSEEKEKFHLADSVDTAKKVVAELKKKKCQVIVALAHMEEDEQGRLAQAIPEIHFILSGHIRHYQLHPVQANMAHIFIAGSRGEHLGKVDFSIEQKKLPFQYQLVDLTAKYADHSQTQEWLNQYKTDLQNLLKPSP